MSSSTFNSKSVLKAYGLAALLVAAVHVWITYSDSVWSELYRYSLPVRDDALRVEARLRLASNGDERSNIVLMGSSQAREDFDVEYLNQRFQSRNQFINLGVSGQGSPIEMYMLTPRVIDAKPGLVIYMPFIGSLYYPYAFGNFAVYFDPNILPLMNTIYGWPELLDHSKAIAWGYLGRASILIRYRTSIQHMLSDAVVRWITDAPPKAARTFAYHKRKPESHFRKMIEKYRSRPRYHDHRYRALNEAAFHKMAMTLEEQGIPLLVVEGPVHPVIRRFYDPALDDQFREFMTSAADTHGFTYLPASELPRFGDDNFNDITHLNAGGRARLTDFLAGYLQAHGEQLGLESK